LELSNADARHWPLPRRGSPPGVTASRCACPQRLSAIHIDTISVPARSHDLVALARQCTATEA
jgi:uncharacterized protein YcaQ